MAQATSPFSGLVSDARIFTFKGEYAVQDLQVGDRVIARDGGMIPIVRIETISLIARAIYVIAGSLGHSRPDRDTLLAADQTVFLRDWRAQAFAGQEAALLPARALVDGEFVRDIGLQAMTLHRIFCADPHVLYADGLELGTADARPDRLAARAA
jgi:hypothetical protein